MVVAVVLRAGGGGGRFAVGVGFGEGACMACWDCCHLFTCWVGLVREIVGMEGVGMCRLDESWMSRG